MQSKGIAKRCTLRAALRSLPPLLRPSFPLAQIEKENNTQYVDAVIHRSKLPLPRRPRGLLGLGLTFRWRRASHLQLARGFLGGIASNGSRHTGRPPSVTSIV